MANVLISWVGEADLEAASVPGRWEGPIAQAVAARRFDEIHLLSNRPRSETTGFLSWLWERASVTVVPHFVKLPSGSPTDFGDVHAVASTVVQALVDGRKASQELFCNLSSGSSAMAAAWIVLAKTRFPAELIQSSRDGGVETVGVPFDISAEFISSGDRLLERGMVRAPGEGASGEIAYQSPTMVASLRKAERAAISDVTVLIEGEPGVEKEVLARTIHDRSRRAKEKFRAFNCGAFPGDLIESILFGRESVAFASEERRGELENANGSTLFLDEIGELPPAAQSRLLRVLSDGEVPRVGGREPIPVDVRIIAATSCDLAKEVAEMRFREDLFYRLAIAVIRMPALREMRDDLPKLIDHFFESANHQYAGLTPKKLSVKARNELLAHLWPGNVRELQSMMARLVVWSEVDTISPGDVRQNLLSVSQRDDGASAVVRPFEEGFKLEDVLDEVSRSYIERALEETGGVKAKAVELLGMSNATTLTNWMKRLGMKAGARN